MAINFKAVSCHSKFNKNDSYLSRLCIYCADDLMLEDFRLHRIPHHNIMLDHNSAEPKINTELNIFHLYHGLYVCVRSYSLARSNDRHLFTS